MTFDAAFWAFAALVVFLAAIVWLKVPQMVTRILDARIKKIEAELAEAERLRLEAKSLLEDYAKRRTEAEKEAEEIVAAAREEAFKLTAEAKVQLEQLITRREKAVADRIAQAEQQAIAEVRSRSADLAVEAARVLLTRKMGENGDAMIEQSIKDVASRLN